MTNTDVYCHCSTKLLTAFLYRQFFRLPVSLWRLWCNTFLRPLFVGWWWREFTFTCLLWKFTTLKTGWLSIMLFHGVSFSSNTHISVFSVFSCILLQLRVTYCFSLAVFPAVMVIISLSTAAGKDGIKSFVDDEQLMRNLYRYKKTLKFLCHFLSNCGFL